jgi:hypothetical protein
VLAGQAIGSLELLIHEVALQAGVIQAGTAFRLQPTLGMALPKGLYLLGTSPLEQQLDQEPRRPTVTAGVDLGQPANDQGDQFTSTGLYGRHKGALLATRGEKKAI